jgi:Zn-dependent protease
VSLTPYLLAWRTTPLHDREVVDALVDPAHARPSAELARALHDWPGTYYWSDEADGRHLVLTRSSQRPREAWFLHGLLFIAVLFFTTLSGAVFWGALPPDLGLAFSPIAWRGGFFRAWASGLSFALPLLGILLFHELGHYVAARRYRLNVSPPFFLPGPTAPWGIGTLGAFIRLRTILNDRRQLIDVGAAGPIVGFLVAIPLLWIGLALSNPIAEPGVQGMVVPWGGGETLMPLGDSIITLAMRKLVHGGQHAIVLHPIAFAGWFGMFVTTLNLLPMAQLDGGHIVYAAVPAWHQRVARAIWFAVMLMGWFWIGWLLWGFVVLLMSRGQLGHPPVLDAYRPLPKSRFWLAWISLLLFLLTFAPAPFRS